MRKLLVATLVTAAALGGLAGPASAQVTVCHDVRITVNGQSTADAGCTTLPPQG